MTRINVLNVEDLTNDHLLAEYKEITRPFNKAYKRLLSGKLDFTRYDSYRLNTGHETFFFDKLQWLYHRYHQLRDELLRRGYNINQESFNKISRTFIDRLSESKLWGWYEPTSEDKYLNMARLVNRTNLESVLEELSK